MINAGLFHDGIGGMPRLNFTIHSHISARNGAEPNIVVTFAMP